MNSNTYPMEDHYSHFPELISPYANQLEEQVTQWLNNFVTLSPALYEKLKRSAIGHSIARYHPTATFEQLLPLSRFMLWAFIFDDLYKDASAEKLQQVQEQTIYVLKGGNPPAGDEILYHLSIVHETFLASLPQYWLHHFYESVKYFIDGLIMESAYKHTGQPISQEQYWPMRIMSAGMVQFTDLTEIATGNILSLSLYYHPSLHQLRMMASILVTLHNDYVSYDREKKEKDTVNIIHIYEHENGCSREEALAYCLGLHQQYITSFLQLSASLPDFGPFNQAAEKYAANVGILTKAVYCWSHKDTSRYSVSEY